MIAFGVGGLEEEERRRREEEEEDRDWYFGRKMRRKTRG